MNYFEHENIDLELLKKKAYNLRWASVEEDVIPLTAADPDFKVAQPIRDAIHNYVEEGYFSYGATEGLPEFKDALKIFFTNKRNLNYSADLIFPTSSAASAIYLTLQSIINEGDEVVIFGPVDFLFPTSIKNAGGIVKSIDYTGKGWQIEDFEKLITQRTKCVMICNPHNPVGKVWSREELTSIVEICEKYDLKIVSDEIWSDIVFEAEFVSVATINQYSKENTFTVFGFSKSYGLAGLRLGCVIAPDSASYNKIVALSLSDKTVYGVPPICQIAGIAALNKAQDWLYSFVQHLKSQRDFLFEELNRFEFFELDQKPQGTYVIFPKLKNTSLNSEEFTKEVLKQCNVAIVPGGEKYFGIQSEGYVRMSYATSRQTLVTMLERLSRLSL